MAFKLQATASTTAIVNKQYLYMIVDSGPAARQWVYVSADAATTVDGSGYITASTNADHQQAVNDLRVGDLIWAYQVGSIDDTRTLEDDLAAGVSDLSLHMVLVNDGAVIDLSDDLLGATVTYGD